MDSKPAVYLPSDMHTLMMVVTQTILDSDNSNSVFIVFGQCQLSNSSAKLVKPISGAVYFPMKRMYYIDYISKSYLIVTFLFITVFLQSCNKTAWAYIYQVKLYLNDEA